jgi:hypothetical protein
MWMVAWATVLRRRSAGRRRAGRRRGMVDDDDWLEDVENWKIVGAPRLRLCLDHEGGKGACETRS